MLTSHSCLHWKSLWHIHVLSLLKSQGWNNVNIYCSMNITLYSLLAPNLRSDTKDIQSICFRRVPAESRLVHQQMKKSTVLHLHPSPLLPLFCLFVWVPPPAVSDSSGDATLWEQNHRSTLQTEHPVRAAPRFQLDSNWLEVDCIIRASWDDICCDFINKTELNWIYRRNTTSEWVTSAVTVSQETPATLLHNQATATQR